MMFRESWLTYPFLLNHVGHFLHGGVLVIAREVVQHAKGRYFLPSSKQNAIVSPDFMYGWKGRLTSWS